MNIIDELVVRLGLDPTDWKKGQQEADRSLAKTKEAAHAGAVEWESLAKRGSEFLSVLQTKALGLASIFLGGLGVEKALVHFANLDSATGRTARIFNIATSELSAWEAAVKTVGGTNEDVVGSFQGIVSTIEKFRMGMGAEVGLFRAFGVNPLTETGEARTPDVILKEILASPEWQRSSLARRQEYMNMMGVSGGMFNLLALGGTGLQDRLQQAREIGVLTKEQAEHADAMQKSWAQMVQAAEQIQRIMTDWAAPGLTSVMDSMRDFLVQYQPLMDRILSRNTLEDTTSDFVRSMNRLLMPASFFNTVYGAPGPSRLTPLAASSWPSFGSAGYDAHGVEAYIRKSAAERGIDPQVALAVARSEGLYKYTGDLGSSFGPFQLHYGGIAPGMMSSGLGDSFTKQTGLNARDPSTVRQQIDFALDQAAKGGWGPWHGWHGSQWAGIGGGRGNQTTATTHINTINVNTRATDAPGIGRSIKAGIEDAALASFSNFSPN